jgi:predicted nucleic acid-binding protein
MKIYLDVCCLNRPFDDASEPRVAIEAAAVNHLLRLIDASQLMDYSSEMAQVEIERNPDLEWRRRVKSLLPPSSRIIPLSQDLLDVANRLATIGFQLADAVHLAAAQQIGVDAFVTVDDKLLRRSKRYKRQLGIRVMNPVSFLRELGK